MGLQIKQNIDLNKNQLLQTRAESLGSAPASPIAGQFYYDTSLEKIGVYTTGAGWIYFLDDANNITDILGDSNSGIVVTINGTDATISLLAASNTQNGYMSSTDKDKLDKSTDAATANTLVERDANGIIAVNQITITNAPTNPTDVVTKEYADNLIQGLRTKQPARAIATTNITLSGEQTIDNVVLVTGDRILVIGQTTATENGIYIVDGGAWSRSTDFEAGFNAANTYLFVQEGSTNADTGWICTNDTGTDVIGTDAIEFVQFSRAGVLEAGQGLIKVGNIINAIAGDDSIQINADDFIVKRDTAGALILNGTSGMGVNTDGTFIKIESNAITIGDSITKTVYTNITVGDTPGPVTVTHNLNTRNLHVTVIDDTTYEEYLVGVTHDTLNSVIIDATGSDTGVIVIISGNIGSAI